MKKIIIFLLLTISLFTFSKDFYIGDKISLKINGDISEENIRNSFNDFEILSLEKNEDLNETIITFASYSTGEKKIKLGSKNIELNILSSLSEEDKNIYESLYDINNTFVEKDYPYLAIGSSIFGVFLFILSLCKILIDRVNDPYYIYLKNMKKITQDNWREDISLYTRDYLDRKFNTNFLGGEYSSSTFDVFKHDYITLNDIDFFKNLDLLKFSRNKNGNMNFSIDTSKNIVKRIEMEVKRNGNI